MKHVVEIDIDMLGDTAITLAQIMAKFTEQLFKAGPISLQKIAEEKGTMVLTEGASRQHHAIVYREQLVDEPFQSQSMLEDFEASNHTYTMMGRRPE